MMAWEAWPFRSLVVVGFVVLAVSLTLAEEQVHTIYVNSEDNIKLGKVHDPLDEVTNCTLTNNNGKQFMLYPEKTGRTEEEEKEYSKFSLRNPYRCKYSVYKITNEDAGTWKMEMTLNTSAGIITETSLYNVKVRKIYEEKSSNPPQKINVYPDQRVSIHFNEEFSNLKSCKLLNPEQIEYNLRFDKTSEVKKLEKCGVKLYVKSGYGGPWTLIADLDNNTAYAITYDLVIKDEKDLKLNQSELLFKRGEQGIISGQKLNNVKICIIENPNGVQQPMQTGLCYYTITSVTEHDEGIWKIYYGLEGYQYMVKQEIDVRTYGVSAFNSSVTYKPNGDINLLCQVRGRDLKFCSFIRPDGEILHMTYGVGNDKYEYYGESMNIREGYQRYDQNYDCGITIHNVSSEDYGPWRCLLKFQAETLGSVLKVKSAGTHEEYTSNVTASDVYVKRGDSYKVKCTAGEILSYCWLRSPNGTIHNVHVSVDKKPKDVKPPALNYEGGGLELGECGARIDQANASDDGRWTCHMGIFDGPEIQGSFNVIVKDTQLMAAQNEISLESSGNTDLICHPLFESNWVIESCRWINPLGNGINVDVQGRYVTEIKPTLCKLTIRNPDPNIDVGEWTCHARMSLEENTLDTKNVLDRQEVSAQLHVTSQQHLGFPNANTGLFMGLLICSCLAVGLILFQRYKLRMRQSDEEIILDKSTGFA